MIPGWRSIATIAGVIALPCSVVAQSATITGQVVLEGSAISVGYAVLGVMPGGHEQFSDADGRFLLHVAVSGRVTLSARRIGYAPLDRRSISVPVTASRSVSSCRS